MTSPVQREQMQAGAEATWASQQESTGSGKRMLPAISANGPTKNLSGKNPPEPAENGSASLIGIKRVNN